MFDEQRLREFMTSHGLTPDPPSGLSRLGIAKNATGQEWPIHGLRHPPEGRSCGWYVWSGELLGDTDFFDALCVHHLEHRLPWMLPLLSLPPGCRFLVAPNYLDLWQDDSLFDIQDD